MAVMTTSLMDKPSFDPKGPLAPSSDVMVLESDINGLAPSADALFQSDNTPTENTVPPSIEQPILNGKPQEDAPTDSVPPLAPAENVTSGIGPTAPFLPEKSETEPITEVPPAIEAPTSDVRNEMDHNADTSSTEAQNTANLDAMEITDGGASRGTINGVVDTIVSGVGEPTKASESIASNGDVTDSSMVGGPLQSQEDQPATESIETAPIEDSIMEDVPSQSKVRPREEDDADDDEEPSAKRTKTEEAEQTPASVDPTTTVVDSIVDTPVADAPVDASTQAATYADSYIPLLPKFDSEPLTDRQRSGLLKVLQGAKKAKPAALFKLPVDYVALNIPTYPDLIKNPMDLMTMENKLKDGKYGSVDDFLTDVSHIVRNTFMFNGPAHAVSQAGRALEAYITKVVQQHAVRGNAEAIRNKSAPPPPPEKKESRRRSTAAKADKPIVAPPAPAAVSPTTTYAPKDGVPIIRRDSTTNDGRPKREIQRPKPRDLPYSVKPRKKKFQIELKFCETVLNEVKKQKYAKISWPFATPVDPVALNIPNYHKLIKKPMDMSTIEKKLKQGDYQTSKDFKGDFDLMFANCFKFNPETDDVHKMGKQFQEQVNDIWSTKDDWIANHQPQSEPMSSAEESDEEEDASDEEQDIRQRDLHDIQRQIAELTNRAQTIIQNAAKATSPKARGKKSGKSGKTSSKSKKLGSGGLGASKTKVKKPAKPLPPLSFEQKQEISNSIGELNESDMGKAMQIIKNGCPNLGGGDDEELEIDMEMIPEEVLRQLLRFVRSVRSAANQKPELISDDEFEPPKGAAAKSSKSKKNKPMNKKEQEESIEAIKRQLESFSKPGGSGSEEPISPAQDDSSSDEDAASESEEE